MRVAFYIAVPLINPVVELVDTAAFKADALPGLRVQIPPGLPTREETNMASGKMKIVEERLKEKREELARIQAEIALLEDILAEANGKPRASSGRQTRTPIKKHVLTYLQNVGANGLNANMVLDMAASDHIELERASVSSLLSRLKSEGVVVYLNDKYVLKEFAEQNTSRSANVHFHPASRPAS